MAIAYDAQSNNGTSGTGTSVTLSHTCSGSNRILWVGLGIYESTGGDCITGVTYNGVAMTQAIKYAASATEEVYLYYLINPDLGTHNIVVSASTTVDEFNVKATSFTGAKQSGVPDASVSNKGSGVTSLTTTLTTIADNCWLVGMYNSNASNVSAGTGITFRNGITSSKQMGDSNSAQTPAGSHSMQVTASSSIISGIMCSFAPVTSTDYPLTAAVGVFTLTGVVAGLKLGWKMTAALGQFTLTSIATVLNIGRKMIASLGTFVLTGINASLYYGKLLTAALGTFTLTGVDATITSTRTMVAALGTFTLTSINTILSVGRTLVAATGAFVLTGYNALVNGFRIMTAALGQFTLTGIAATFPRASKITAVVGTFVLTGTNVAFSAARTMVAVLGTFTLTGIAALFPRASKIFATVGEFTLTGNSITVLVNGIGKTWVAASKSAVATLSNIAKNAETWINKLKS